MERTSCVVHYEHSPLFRFDWLSQVLCRDDRVDGMSSARTGAGDAGLHRTTICHFISTHPKSNKSGKKLRDNVLMLTCTPIPSYTNMTKELIYHRLQLLLE